MKFIGALTLLLTTISDVKAFAPVNVHKAKSTAFAVPASHPSSSFATAIPANKHRTPTSSLYAAETEITETAMSIRELYLGAGKMLNQKLNTIISDEYMQGIINHFVIEYVTAASEAKIQYDALKAASDVDLSNIPEPNSPEEACANMQGILELAMKYGQGDYKYKFGVTHDAIRGAVEGMPHIDDIDYYAWGCNFFRPAMDIVNSAILGKENFEKARKQIEAGENVVFFANHQSEADPQVLSVAMEQIGYGDWAADVTYVAGHKVTTDPLAVPFSMGRNLICIHSKKHINSDEDAKPMKQKQNLLAMNGMLSKLKKGGCTIWVAPSGGRDRRDVDTNQVPLAEFDSKTIDMFRLMGNKSKVPTHFYSMGMVSYDLCPPPDTVEAGTGEKRNVRYVPIGVGLSDELGNSGGLESRHAFSDHAFEEAKEQYEQMLQMISSKKK